MAVYFRILIKAENVMMWLFLSVTMVTREMVPWHPHVCPVVNGAIQLLFVNVIANEDWKNNYVICFAAILCSPPPEPGANSEVCALSYPGKPMIVVGSNAVNDGSGLGSDSLGNSLGLLQVERETDRETETETETERDRDRERQRDKERQRERQIHTILIYKGIDASWIKGLVLL